MDSHCRTLLVFPCLFESISRMKSTTNGLYQSKMCAVHAIQSTEDIAREGYFVRARMIQLHMRNGPIDVQKKTGQQRLPRHLNSIFHDSQIEVRKMHSIAACNHSIHSVLSWNAALQHISRKLTPRTTSTLWRWRHINGEYLAIQLHEKEPCCIIRWSAARKRIEECWEITRSDICPSCHVSSGGGPHG